MILVEDGLLGLNRPVSDYIPAFRGDGKHAVRVLHLLTHTSGLRDVDIDAHAEKQQDAVAIPPPEATQHPVIQERLFLRYDTPLWKAPRVEMSYCNYGYNLIQARSTAASCGHRRWLVKRPTSPRGVVRPVERPLLEL
jgi:CubicO group peptidase (beta-lactamase class C family)